jgi:iron complex transport system substrate-binding protein
MSSPAVAAGSAPTSNITEGCVDTYSPDVDYFPDKITIEEATDFEVRYKNNYKVLTVRTDLVSPGMSPQVVVMVQCGTPAPELTGDLAGATLIEVPVTTFGLTRNDDLASAVALGLTDNLVTHGFSSVFPEDINARIQSGEISHNAGAFGAQDMDFEAVAGKDPDVMFVLLSSEAGLAGVERLAALGIPTVPTLTSVSTNVLGRAEWAKVIALPFNQEARANDVLGDVLDTYRDLSAQARSQADKPTAIFAQCGANGECTVARNSWQAKIMEDAGLVNVLADPSAPQRLEPMAIEQVFEAGADADWMIIFSPPGSQYTGPLLASFRSYQQGQIISHDADGVSIRDGVYEYFYSGALRPDLLLRDIVALVYPGLAPEHTTTYMGISPLTQQ